MKNMKEKVIATAMKAGADAVGAESNNFAVFSGRTERSNIFYLSNRREGRTTEDTPYFGDTVAGVQLMVAALFDRAQDPGELIEIST